MSAKQKRYFGGPRARPRRRRKNPGVAEYFANRPRRKGRRKTKRRYYRSGRRRHNPGSAAAVQRRIVKDPTGFVMDGLTVIGGAYGAITVGNLALGWVSPIMLASIDYTSAFARAASRGAAAWGGDYLLKEFARVKPNTLRMWRIGAGAGIVASLAFDLIGYTFVMGRGDNTSLPMEVFTQASEAVGVAGTGAYTRHRLGAYTRKPIAGTGAYVHHGMAGNGGGMGQSALAKQSGWGS